MSYEHNGGPPIEDDKDAKLRYVKINISELLEGLEELSWEQRGFYVTALFKMYARMGGLPACERQGATIMRCDIRVYKRMRDHLLASGKFYQDGDTIYNKRVERVIADYVREFKKRSEAARQREAARRQSAAKASDDGRATDDSTLTDDFFETSSKSPRKVSKKSAASSEEVQKKLPGLGEEKSTKSNGAPPRAAPEPHQPNNTPVPTIKNLTINQYRSEEYMGDPGGSPAPSIEAQFEAFWEAFPATRKRGRGDCFDRFKAIVTGKVANRKATAEQLIAAVKARRGMDADPQFAPRPATWLNQGRWLDPLPDGSGAGGGTMQRLWWQDQDMIERMSDQDWRDGIAKYANGTWPVAKLGYPPGHMQCVVPKRIVDELKLEEIYTRDGIKRGYRKHD